MISRLLVVARRFWPMVDESSLRLVEWVAMLRGMGIDVSVLTARWHSSWPADSDCREAKVHRVLPAPKSSWSETIFLRNIATWIAKHRSNFDAIYVDESSALLHQVVAKYVAGDRPIFARFQGVPETSGGDRAGWPSLSFVGEACRRTRLTIVPNAIAQRQLIAAGVPREQTVRIPDVPWKAVSVSTAERVNAAKALRAINQDMAIPNDTRIITCVGDMVENESMLNFLKALFQLASSAPAIRAWMIGSGSGIPSLYELVKNEGLHHEILFLSPFDDLESIFQVSDIFVCPSSTQGCDFVIPHCVAAGIPFIATADTLFPIPDPLATFRVADKSATSIFLALDDWFARIEDWRAQAENARQAFVAQASIEKAQQQWRNVLS